MINTRIPKVLLVLVVLCGFSLAQIPAGSSSAGSRSSSSNAGFMPLSQVKEGMRGTARTVFSGSVPEEFSVEILGVVPGAIGPKQDMIVGRLSGGQADRTAVFAGMSGSPVYINGKLVGAISYSFPFAKEAICGITPIEQMISMFETKAFPTAHARDPRPVSFTELARSEWNPEMPFSTQTQNGIVSVMNSASPLMAIAGQTFQPISTPVAFTGFSQQTLSVFTPQLTRAGLLPVSAVGGTAAITPLKKANAGTLVGGTSVSMQLTRGDYSIAAAGTVTLRDGEKIYAFGHPFLSLGTSDLPMSESHVVTVIPNMNNSFKLAVPDSMVGAMTQDLATGVFGKLGQSPRMIPVRIELETSRGQTEVLNFEVAKDEFLTPLLLNMTTYNSAVAHERSIGDLTIEIDGEIKVAGRESLRIDRRFAGGQAPQFAAASVAMPVSMLLRSGFEGFEISGVSLKIRTRDGRKTAVIERLSIDQSEVRAGETVEIQAFARTNSGNTVVQRISLTIPADADTGPLSITIADGSLIESRSAAKYFVPDNVDELLTTMRSMRNSGRLYLQAYRTTTGAIVGTSEMPNLPPSVLATLNNERTTGGVRPAVQTVVAEIEIAPSEFLITGEKTLTINVVR